MGLASTEEEWVADANSTSVYWRWELPQLHAAYHAAFYTCVSERRGLDGWAHDRPSGANGEAYDDLAFQVWLLLNFFFVAVDHRPVLPIDVFADYFLRKPAATRRD